MNLELKKELPIIGIILTPFVYLAIVWNSLPERVPVHWNYKGEIDRWGSKFSLLAVLFMLPVLIYVLMIAASKFDPKKRLLLMGGKFYQLKFILVLFMSLVALFIIYISKNQSLTSPAFLHVGIGALLMILGNYFKVIQPNYIIGIRTPWTLENNEVWKATHAFAGKLWFFWGLILTLGGLIFQDAVFSKVFVAVVLVLAFVPIVYSYFKFKSLQE